MVSDVAMRSSIKDEGPRRRGLLELDPPSTDPEEDDDYEEEEHKEGRVKRSAKWLKEEEPIKDEYAREEDKKHLRHSRKDKSQSSGTKRRRKRRKRYDESDFESSSGSDLVCLGDNFRDSKRDLEPRKRRNYKSRHSRDRSVSGLKSEAERSFSRNSRDKYYDRHSRSHKRSRSYDRKFSRRTRSRSRSRSKSRKRSREQSRDSFGRKQERSRYSRLRSRESRHRRRSVSKDRREKREPDKLLVKPEINEKLEIENVNPKELCDLCGKAGHLRINCTKRPPIDFSKKVCYICGETGHPEEDCPMSDRNIRRARRKEYEASRICYNCGEKGHIKIDCKNETREWRECHNCLQIGHLKKDCDNPTVSKPGMVRKEKCYGCGDRGHIQKHCPNGDMCPRCFNCLAFGHIAAVCKKAAKTMEGKDVGRRRKADKARVIVEIE